MAYSLRVQRVLDLGYVSVWCYQEHSSEPLWTDKFWVEGGGIDDSELFLKALRVASERYGKR